MFCKYCGAQIADDSTFCKSCGAKLGSAAEPVQPAYDLPAYSEPVSPEPVYQYYPTPQQASQPSKVASGVLSIIAASFMAIVFIIVVSERRLEPCIPMYSISLICGALLVVGSFIRGKAGDVIAAIGVFLMAIVAFISLTLAGNEEPAALIVGLIFKVGYILSGVGILVGKRGLIKGGAIPALIGCFCSDFIFYASEQPRMVTSSIGPSFIILGLIAAILFAIAVMVYWPTKK